MPKIRIAALILAAGSSSRMGTLKQLLPFKKATILEETIKNVKQADIDKVYCVLGAEASSIKPYLQKHSIDLVINSNYKEGLSSSIKCGIERIQNEGFDAVLIALGDQPLIQPKFFNALIKEFKSDQKNIVAADYNNSFGVPVVISKSYFSDLLKLKGDKGAKEFLNSQNHTIIGMKTDNLFDIDTQKDYQKLIKRIEKT